MKKIFVIALVAFFGMILFTSCKKDNIAPTPTMTGFWKGKYGLGPTTYPNHRYAVLFRDDGTVRVFNNTDTSVAEKAEGAYTISGPIVISTYKFLNTGFQYTTKAVVDANFTLLEGSWGYLLDYSNGGRFFVNKQ